MVANCRCRSRDIRDKDGFGGHATSRITLETDRAAGAWLFQTQEREEMDSTLG
eukprot:CAMPEP_0116567958 /NCGR_PEP_ID=MMETSP0397-20121206/15325_1 /TAXON_ID=216820 /ORGANISM="Cyclophora tenuis, Strain ECT3854" /LENGTH=52 /DNA_ID=CAMNT_0004095065 /DNA_START=1 /DNA_END=156 /DNA_ORIENTATION=-